MNSDEIHSMFCLRALARNAVKLFLTLACITAAVSMGCFWARWLCFPDVAERPSCLSSLWLSMQCSLTAAASFVPAGIWIGYVILKSDAITGKQDISQAWSACLAMSWLLAIPEAAASIAGICNNLSTPLSLLGIAWSQLVVIPGIAWALRGGISLKKDSWLNRSWMVFSVLSTAISLAWVTIKAGDNFLYSFADIVMSIQGKAVAFGTYTPYERSLVLALATTLVIWNFPNVSGLRQKSDAFHFKDWRVLAYTACMFIVMILSVNLLGRFASMAPLLYSDWVLIIVLSSPIFWLGQILIFLKYE